ncbi:hypothetical protein SUGI_0764070 [Cryptomeria japonica]|nr:hypothetical protein SUGI_0764070 [Cryptomeria japonica]
MVVYLRLWHDPGWTPKARIIVIGHRVDVDLEGEGSEANWSEQGVIKVTPHVNFLPLEWRGQRPAARR